LSWASLGITAIWAGVTAAIAVEASQDWRLLAGLLEWMVCLAGSALGLALATLFSGIGLFFRGRYRSRSLLALCVCMLLWGAAYLYWTFRDVMSPARPNPPGPAHGDMAADVPARLPLRPEQISDDTRAAVKGGVGWIICESERRDPSHRVVRHRLG
jgi:hypothetical protein